MALTLDNQPTYKAPTGPNPSQRYGSPAQVAKQTGVTQPGGINQSVTGPGASQQNTTQAPAPAAAPPQYDYLTDPVLQQILGQQAFARASAEADALAQRKLALINYGDPNLALAVTGDKLTADAAAANVGSTLAQLSAKQQTDTRGINETENKSNLFYSSDAGYQLGLSKQAYLQSIGQAAGNVQGQLGTIGTNLLAQEQASFDAESKAQSDAYNRALQNPALGASTPTAGGSTGTGSTGGQQDTTGSDVPAGSTPTTLQRLAATPTNGVYPATTATPTPINVSANKSGGSANKTQGVFAIH